MFGCVAEIPRPRAVGFGSLAAKSRPRVSTNGSCTWLFVYSLRCFFLLIFNVVKLLLLLLQVVVVVVTWPRERRAET